MRTETRTVRIGEWLGPVDWDGFDFEDAMSGMYRCHPRDGARLRQQKIDQFRKLDEAIKRGERYEATTYGGIPRCGWGEVVQIGMYDGWPYWKPYPSVRIANYLGETASFTSIVEIRPFDTHKEGDR